MLYEFINRQKSVVPAPEESPDERTIQIMSSFLSMVGFLQDPTNLSRPRVNRLMRAMFPTKGSSPIPAIIDIAKSGSRIIPRLPEDRARWAVDTRFVVPGNYIQLVQADIVGSLGQLARLASIGADIVTFTYPYGHNDPGSRLRAGAYEAEVYLGLDEIARHQGYPLVFTEGQLQVMRENPQGFESLPQQYQRDSLQEIMRRNMSGLN